jgi:chromate transporter
VIRTFAQLASLFSVLSLSAFGGGKVILPSMHQAAVGEYGWMNDQQFVDLFSISMAAPGPSMMVVSLVGLKACLPYGTAMAILGALIATVAMFLPSSILVLIVGRFWDSWKTSPWHDSIQQAMMPISTGLILAATFIIAKNSIHTIPTAIMGLIALCLMVFTKLNPVIMIVAAAAISWAFLR